MIIHEIIMSRGHSALLGAINNLEHTFRAWTHRLDRHDVQFYLGEYEAQLKRFETRIQDEISHVLAALNEHKRVDSAKAALIIVGHELIEKANGLIKQHDHDAKFGHIFEEMKSEIKQIQDLMTKIGSSTTVSEKDNQQLYRHELTMAKLFHELETHRHA